MDFLNIFLTQNYKVNFVFHHRILSKLYKDNTMPRQFRLDPLIW